MAKLRMTYKNLKALRKSKEYQAALIDLVSVGVVPKATAEGLLGYNIPANLITDDENSGTDNPIVDPGTDPTEPTEPTDPTEPTEPTDPTEPTEPTEPGYTVTVLYFNETANDGAGVWETAEYTSDDPSGADILAFAKIEFSNDTLNSLYYVEANPEYVEGESGIFDKYITLSPQPEYFESEMLAVVCYYDNNGR